MDGGAADDPVRPLLTGLTPGALLVRASFLCRSVPLMSASRRAPADRSLRFGPGTAVVGVDAVAASQRLGFAIFEAVEGGLGDDDLERLAAAVYRAEREFEQTYTPPPLVRLTIDRLWRELSWAGFPPDGCEQARRDAMARAGGDARLPAV